MTTCGLWLARRRLVAVLVSAGQARRAIRAATTDDARYGLLEYLVAAETELVTTDALARVDVLPAQAARRGLTVWTADDGLVAAVLAAAAIRDPARAAATWRGFPASRSCAPRSGGSRRRALPRASSRSSDP